VSVLSLALTGDTIVQRRLSGIDDATFRGAVDVVRGCGAAMTNLEGCIQDGEDWHAFLAGNGRGATYIRTPPYVGEELSWMGFNLVSLANNHAADFGERGMLTTLRYMRRWPHLRGAGIGATLSDATAPAYLETPAGIVAFIAVADWGPRAGGDLPFPPPIGALAADRDRYFRGRPGMNLLRYDCTFTIPEDDLSALRRISDGMAWEQAKEVRRSGGGRAEPFAGASPSSDEVDSACFYFMGRRFVPGGAYDFVTDAYQGDIDRIVAAVVEARRQADWVVVSLHHQGAGRSKEEPPDHSLALGRASLAAGADVFVAHGALRVGAIEFIGAGVAVYGQGSWTLQLDQVKRLPFEMMDRFGLGYSDEAGGLLARRATKEANGGAQHGARRATALESRLSTITVVELQAWERPQVQVFPLELAGAEEGRLFSGIPRLLPPDSDRAALVLDMVERRSRPFGTRVQLKHGIVRAEPAEEGV
jgi:poly-gamma-glutamate synthesis protein (capsule biosynthesis protein)